jgi:fatty acid desaturase
MNPNKVSRAHAPDENPIRPLLGESAVRSLPNRYSELKRLIKQRGHLDQRPASFAGKSLLTLGLLAVWLTLLLFLDNFWLQLMNAACLAFVFVQISLLAHDIGYRQFSFRSPWKNDWLTLTLGSMAVCARRGAEW